LVKRDKQIDRSHLLPIHFFGNRLNDCRINKPEARRGFISRLQRSSGAKKCDASKSPRQRIEE
jgi:hypothetical protein